MKRLRTYLHSRGNFAHSSSELDQDFDRECTERSLSNFALSNHTLGSQSSSTPQSSRAHNEPTVYTHTQRSLKIPISHDPIRPAAAAAVIAPSLSSTRSESIPSSPLTKPSPSRLRKPAPKYNADRIHTSNPGIASIATAPSSPISSSFITSPLSPSFQQNFRAESISDSLSFTTAPSTFATSPSPTSLSFFGRVAGPLNNNDIIDTDTNTNGSSLYNNTHSRSKSVRIIVPDDALLGAASSRRNGNGRNNNHVDSRLRSVSAPGTRPIAFPSRVGPGFKTGFGFGGRGSGGRFVFPSGTAGDTSSGFPFPSPSPSFPSSSPSVGGVTTSAIGGGGGGSGSVLLGVVHEHANTGGAEVDLNGEEEEEEIFSSSFSDSDVDGREEEEEDDIDEEDEEEDEQTDTSTQSRVARQQIEAESRTGWSCSSASTRTNSINFDALDNLPVSIFDQVEDEFDRSGFVSGSESEVGVGGVGGRNWMDGRGLGHGHGNGNRHGQKVSSVSAREFGLVGVGGGSCRPLNIQPKPSKSRTGSASDCGLAIVGGGGYLHTPEPSADSQDTSVSASATLHEDITGSLLSVAASSNCGSGTLKDGVQGRSQTPEPQSRSQNQDQNAPPPLRRRHRHSYSLALAYEYHRRVGSGSSTLSDSPPPLSPLGPRLRQGQGQGPGAGALPVPHVLSAFMEGRAPIPYGNEGKMGWVGRESGRVGDRDRKPVYHTHTLHQHLTPLLPGMHTVISLEGREYLVVLESILEEKGGGVGSSTGKDEDHLSTSSPAERGSRVRVRVVGGYSKERMYPGAYVVMFIEERECLVRVIREIKAGDVRSESQDGVRVNKEKEVIRAGSNPHHMSWRPGMHITVGLAGDTFLVVQIEQLEVLNPSNLNLDKDGDQDFLVQVAGIDAGWWTIPEPGGHVVLILSGGEETEGLKGRKWGRKWRQEYLVCVVRRLTRTFQPKVDGSLMEVGHQDRLPDSGDRNENRIKRETMKNSGLTLTMPVVDPPASPSTPPLPLSPSLPDVLTLARGYRYLSCNPLKGSLRFELLLEDRSDECYNTYMVPHGGTSTWVVTGGERDASWVFRKVVNESKSLNESTGSIRVEPSGDSTSPDLPHHFSFERQGPNDAWVFKPAMYDHSGMMIPSSSSLSSHSSKEVPIASHLPINLDELLMNQGSTLRGGVGWTIFVTKLLLLRREAGDIIVFHLTPASREQVRELGRRVRVSRDESVKQLGMQRTDTGGEAQNNAEDSRRDDVAATAQNGAANHKVNKLLQRSLLPQITVPEAHRAAPAPPKKRRDDEAEGHDNQEHSSFRLLRCGRDGELIFSPYDLQNTPTLQAEFGTLNADSSFSYASRKRSGSRSGEFTGDFVVYGKSRAEAGLVSYVFYPTDHDDIRPESMGFDKPRKYIYKTNNDNDAWMFFPLNQSSDGHLLGLNVDRCLFRAFMDDTGRIMLDQLPIKKTHPYPIRPGLIRASVSDGVMFPSGLSLNRTNPNGDIYNVTKDGESQKNISSSRRWKNNRSISEEVDITNSKFPNISPGHKSPTEVSAEKVVRRPILLRKRTISFAL
ncbi:hypothetical protein D9757_007316 [Collybiopsis confluens]|uniref:Uncharacterized protein n=1 Tax=Collybiopsis confluens TaxID=2823264 RepID=A0A8H5M6S5_9AGAR|nr:hypothetical protein D9757_007316 [Collybiopsis confluens]